MDNPGRDTRQAERHVHWFDFAIWDQASEQFVHIGRPGSLDPGFSVSNKGRQKASKRRESASMIKRCDNQTLCRRFQALGALQHKGDLPPRDLCSKQVCVRRASEVPISVSGRPTEIARVLRSVTSQSDPFADTSKFDFLEITFGGA
jgi:hypothetical protein